MLPPKLHDRGSNALIAEAEALVPVYTPEWTGAADPHDPGHGLIVLAARLVELLAERVNRVPEKNLLAFLDLVGVERAPGLPAEAPITFTLANAAEGGHQIPAGVEVATTQSETADAQVFETRNAFFATPAQLVHVINLLPADDRYSVLPPLTLPPSPEALADPSRGIEVLSAAGSGLLPVPHELYLASAKLFAQPQPAGIRLDFTATNGTGVGVAYVLNLKWQRFSAEAKQWEDIDIGNFTFSGGVISVTFDSFRGTDKSVVADEEDAWIVGRLKTAPGALPALPVISQIAGAVATAATPTVAPDAALFNDAPLDLSKPAFPFGARPRYGDAFHIASARGFDSSVASVTVHAVLRPYTLGELKAIFGSAPSTTITTTIEWQYLATGDVWKTLSTVTHQLVVPTVAQQTSLASFVQLGAGAPAATQAERDGTLFGVLGGGSADVITFVPPADAAVGQVGGVSSRWIRGVLRSPAPYGRDGSVTFANNVATAIGPTFLPPIIEKIEINYQYKTSAIALDRITTANNFELSRLNPPFFGGGQTLVPVIPLDAAFLGGAAGLYLAFDAPFEDAFISVLMAFVEPHDTAALMPDPAGAARIVWEYLASGFVWKPLDVVDGTSDLTSTGVVGFQAPPDVVPAAIWPDLTGGSVRYWYRARLQSGTYSLPPRLSAVVPNSVMADNQQTFRGDWPLASASGERNQQMTILRQPVLAGDIWVRENEIPGERERAQLLDELTERAIEDGDTTMSSLADLVEERIGEDGEREVWVRWLRVANFRVSDPRSRHYTLEGPSGVVTFGDNVEALIPPIGKDNIVVRGLRSGGGEGANAAAPPLAIKELKTSLSFIDKVFNLAGAVGGTSAWTAEQASELGPQAIKTRRRAVTVEDYEQITLAAFGQVARAKCLATSAPAGGVLVHKPGAVSIIIVPKGTDRSPLPPKGLLRRIEAFLRGRALGAIAAEIFALPPAYVEVAIAATIRPRRPEDASVVQRRVTRALEEFFHPLTGGEHREGWPFGRSVYLSEVFAVVERTEGVDHVVDATFVTAPPVVGSNVLVASGAHQITVV